jgi:two-component system response regulator DesR
MIRVLLAEDQAMFRTAVRRLLELEGDIEVIAEVARADEVVPAVLKNHPDVAIVDIEMPGGDGISAALELRRCAPACRTLIVTVFGRPGFVQRALAGGVAGFVLKDAPVETLAAAIRRCVAGEQVLDAALAAEALRAGPCPLSSTERAILAACATGVTTAEIARHLYLSEGTIRNKLSDLIGKLGARNRTEALCIARDKGWL